MTIGSSAVFVALLLVASPFAGRAHDDQHERGEKHDHVEAEASGSVGPGKAVEAIDEKRKRFKLSTKALGVLGVKFAPIEVRGGKAAVPRKAIVEFGPEYGVYVHDGGWFRLVEVEPISRGASEWSVSSKELASKTTIAVEAVPLLRAAELDAFGGGGHGHAH